MIGSQSVFICVPSGYCRGETLQSELQDEKVALKPSIYLSMCSAAIAGVPESDTTVTLDKTGLGRMKH